MFCVNFAVAESYFSSDFAGELSAGSHCRFHSRMDYLWVIPRSAVIGDHYTLLLQLKKTELSCKLIFNGGNYFRLSNVEVLQKSDHCSNNA